MTSAKKILLTVATPAGVYKGEFPGDATVSEVIALVVKEMGLADSDAFSLAYKGEELAPEARLDSVVPGPEADLDLIASGSAV